jgi:hydrogenase expression/formation protein HypE
VDDIITLAHGSGGVLTHKIINEIFYKNFRNRYLEYGLDSALIDLNNTKIAYTTDSYVVSPIFFLGGDIGKLSVCGTVNDLAVSGAIPQFLTCGFILEEGFLISDLEKIVISMAKTAAEAGVCIVSGDTKVVPRGCVDKVFINTSGIGVRGDVELSTDRISIGDELIVTGSIGDHGTSILIEREELQVGHNITSDCAPLNGITKDLLEVFGNSVKIMRDPTRGGVATTLNEFLDGNKYSIRVFEDKIPVKSEVRGICEMLGMDPLYMANEGKILIIVDKNSSHKVLELLKNTKYGKDAEIIGDIVSAEGSGKVYMKTYAKGHRIVDMLTYDQLPRIC